jgi:hypothetical protein
MKAALCLIALLASPAAAECNSVVAGDRMFAACRGAVALEWSPVDSPTDVQQLHGIACCLTGELATDGTTVFVISEELGTRYQTKVDAVTLAVSSPMVIIGGTPACSGDRNGDGRVTIDEIVAAANNALYGCVVPSEPCGVVFCPPGQVCCNPLLGICTPPENDICIQ